MDPIGKTLSTSFQGTFDGGNHKISNLILNVSIDSANILNAPYHTVGLFGVCNSASVSNLSLSDVTVSVKNESGYQRSYASIDGTSVFTGALCGYTQSPFSVSYCFVESGDVQGTSPFASGNAHAGGLIGCIQIMELSVSTLMHSILYHPQAQRAIILQAILLPVHRQTMRMNDTVFPILTLKRYMNR